MRRVSKTLAAGLAVLLVALGLVACGGSDSSTSTTSEAGNQGQAESNPGDGAAKQGGAKSGEGNSGSGHSDGSSSAGEAAKFVPTHHNDSGGGSKQFVVKGGDNSVQEFGEEADASELDAAAATLHNFLDARAEGNWAAACKYISKGLVESFEQFAAGAKQIEDKSCAGILDKLTNPAAKQSMKVEAEKANVGSLRVEGEQSFLIFTGTDGTVLAMPMANEDGDWKVASLAGTPLS